MKRYARKSAAMRLGTALLLTSAVAACASKGTSFEAYCSLVSPIILTDADIDNLSATAGDQIGKHNDTWKRHCARR